MVGSLPGNRTFFEFPPCCTNSTSVSKMPKGKPLSSEEQNPGGGEAESNRLKEKIAHKLHKP